MATAGTGTLGRRWPFLALSRNVASCRRARKPAATASVLATQLNTHKTATIPIPLRIVIFIRQGVEKMTNSCETCRYCQTRYVAKIMDNTFKCRLLKYKTIDVPVLDGGCPVWCPLNKATVPGDAELPEAAGEPEHKKRKTTTSTAVKARYSRNHYTRLPLDVPKEMAQQFKDKCAAEGVSVQSVLKAAIKDFLEK